VTPPPHLISNQRFALVRGKVWILPGVVFVLFEKRRRRIRDPHPPKVGPIPYTHPPFPTPVLPMQACPRLANVEAFAGFVLHPGARRHLHLLSETKKYGFWRGLVFDIHCQDTIPTLLVSFTHGCLIYRNSWDRASPGLFMFHIEGQGPNEVFFLGVYLCVYVYIKARVISKRASKYFTPLALFSRYKPARRKGAKNDGSTS